MAKKPQNILSATIFSLNKRIVPSDAVFYGTLWNERQQKRVPVEIYDKTVRGTMSHHIEKTVGGDPLKLQREAEKVNVQLIDACSLTPEQDTLIVQFTVNILPSDEGLEACNNHEYVEKYMSFLTQYAEKFGYEELANRYAYNLACGKFLWKNRYGAEQLEVVVSSSSIPEAMVFDGFNVGTIDNPTAPVKALGKIIASALSGSTPFAFLQVSAAVKRGLNQVVYPSQEFIQEKSNSKKKKVLYSTSGIAGMHDQKVGNAIRTIDTWYPGFEDFKRPIAIEVYGAVTNLSCAFRAPNTGESYHDLMIKMTSDAPLTDEQQHYLVAMMIRGGVLGTEKDKK